MAISKEILKKLLDNPALVSASDLESGDDMEMLGDDGSMELPEVDPEAALVEQAPEIADPDEVNQENDLIDESVDVPALPQMDMDVDHALLAKLKKLKSGEPMDDESETEMSDVAADMEAPADLRKKALQKIKQKYLG